MNVRISTHICQNLIFLPHFRPSIDFTHKDKFKKLYLRMTLKRSRNGSSSLSGDELIVDTTATSAAANNPRAVVEAEATGEQTRSAIFSIGFPVRVGRLDQRRFEGFLERCYYCKDRIPHHTDVFMYGILCAFCTLQCRDLQIAQDRAARRRPARVEYTANQGQWPTM